MKKFDKLEYNKKYYKKNCEELIIYQYNYRKENSEKISKKAKEKYKKNHKVILKRKCEYGQSKVNYNTFASQISYADKVRNINDFLQTRCTYCGKWYFPTNQSVQHRIKALNGQHAGECRLYCSDECKQACPIYRKQIYQQGHPLKNQNSSREAQPELRQIVFERDEYICLKCNKHQDDLSVPLHCHHIEGIRWNPLESADIDQCMTVCKDCHSEIHQQEDCGYNDLQCKKAA